jgi:mannose-6-phosphate isomerase
MKPCECKCHRWDEPDVWVEKEQICCQWVGEVNIRPWGRYDILWDGDDCKVKRITVNPGGKLSYQFHAQRSEDWIIINGTPMIILDDVEDHLHPGDRIHIAKGCRHRMENQSKLDVVFIEIQTGSYFGEDDIVRLEDSYDRI